MYYIYIYIIRSCVELELELREKCIVVRVRESKNDFEVWKVKSDFSEKISGEKFEKLFVFAEGVMCDYFDCL
jgi:hypothetical protein